MKKIIITIFTMLFLSSIHAQDQIRVQDKSYSKKQKRLATQIKENEQKNKQKKKPPPRTSRDRGYR